MKKFLLVALLMFASFNVLALDNCYSGAWASPERNGSGITLDVMDDLVVSHYYTWNFGPSRDMYVLVNDNVDGDIVTLNGYTSFMDDDWNYVERWVGEATVEALDADTIQFSWKWKYDYINQTPDTTIAWCLNSECEGSLTYTRVYDNARGCTDS